MSMSMCHARGAGQLPCGGCGAACLCELEGLQLQLEGLARGLAMESTLRQQQVARLRREMGLDAEAETSSACGVGPSEDGAVLGEALDLGPSEDGSVPGEAGGGRGPPTEGETAPVIFGLSTLADSGELRTRTASRKGKVVGKVTKRTLDSGDQYQPRESTWDSCLVIGIDGLGREVSSIVAALALVNVAVQLSFVVILVGLVMKDMKMDPERMLNELLIFRARVGHSAGYADAISKRSMLSQLCSEGGGLPFAGIQADLLIDARRFTSPWGRALCMLSLCCWLLTILKELVGIGHFFRALLTLPGAATFLQVVNDAEESEDTAPVAPQDEWRLERLR